jgi:hypothetical protein
MNRVGYILLGGLLLCAAAFVGAYWVGTAEARNLMRQPQPELAWLKKEFGLGEPEFARVAALHQEYLPKCAVRCRLIEAQSSRLKELLSRPEPDLAEVGQVLMARAKLRSDCELEMLQHFLAVSRTMPPEQGRRYLAWVQEQSSLRGEGMEQRHRQSDRHPAHP